MPCHVMPLACNVQLGLCGGFCALGLGAMVCQLTLGVGLACPGSNMSVQSVMVRRCVMKSMLCLSVRRCSTSRTSTHGCSQGLVRLCSSSCGSLISWVWCIMSETVYWCCWLTVRVVIGHLISPHLAGTDARVIHSFIHASRLRSSKLMTDNTLKPLTTCSARCMCNHSLGKLASSACGT